MRIRNKLRAALLIGCGLIVICVAAAWTIDAVRWRAQVFALVASGKVEDVSVSEILPMLAPGSGYWLAGMVDTRSPYASIRDPFVSSADVRVGQDEFARNCAVCHGASGRGSQTGPSLIGRNLKNGDSDWSIYRTIQRGVAGTAMQPHPWQARRIWSVIAYLRSIDVADGAAASLAAVPKGLDVAPVTFDEIAAVNSPTRDWLTYSGSYSGGRHSALDLVDRTTVARLAPRWIHQFDGVADRIEMSPIVRNGVMFVTYGGKVAALDALTGATLWEYARPIPADVHVCCGVVNRGAAILGETLYVATVDAHLIALSARTGRKIWDTPVVPDYRIGYAITSAPLVIHDLVVTGVAGGDFPTRGFIAAFDAATGKERWRFRTIPEPGEKGHDSWAGDSWKKGGGATWLTGSYDPKLDIIYWGVGNPAPDFNAGSRQGDNLYTCAVVAIRGKTGELLWHFQFTPGDDHDWDSSQIPIVADRSEAGAGRQLLWANRNGFFYVLDRESGRFVRGDPYVKQTWASGFDAKGRPIRDPAGRPSARGTLLYPSASGATNWWAPSYDPALDLVLVPTLDRGGMFFSSEGWDAKEGEQYLGGRADAVDDLPGASGVTAINPATGAVVWRNLHEGRSAEDFHIGGLMSTAGGLTFGSSDRDFFALDTATGSELWRFHAGGRIAAAPVTYLVGREQHVAVTAGRSLISFALVEPSATVASRPDTAAHRSAVLPAPRP